MHTSDCIIPIFLQAMLYIVDFNTVFIIENIECRIEVDSMLSLIYLVLFLIPLKFKGCSKLLTPMTILLPRQFYREICLMSI